MGIYCQFGALLSSSLLCPGWSFCGFFLHLLGFCSRYLLFGRLKFLLTSYSIRISCSFCEFLLFLIVLLPLYFQFFFLFIPRSYLLFSLVIFTSWISSSSMDDFVQSYCMFFFPSHLFLCFDPWLFLIMLIPLLLSRW